MKYVLILVWLSAGTATTSQQIDGYSDLAKCNTAGKRGLGFGATKAFCMDRETPPPLNHLLAEPPQ